MNTLPQILPQFEEIKLLKTEDADLKFQPNCAYLLEEGNSISKFIEKIGKKYASSDEGLNLYDFYTAYNIKFPTIPSTVSLIDKKRLVAMGIRTMEELLQKICENSKSNSPLAVFLSIEARTPEEMLKIKREILQQFIFLRMYLPIIVSENFRAAVKTFDEILNSRPDEKTDITFIGTKKSGKSSLINAVLGAEYTPSSSELPTPNKVSYTWSGTDNNNICVECDGNKTNFENAVEVNEYLAREFRLANKNSSALKPMQVYIPKFPEDLKDFTITDTPGPNFAASKEHTEVTENTLKDIQHCIFIMNYSAHLTNDEIALFDRVYKVLNNKRRHQTIIVAVNRIDEMYAAEVIKSYERFADYILHRLNALGYENIVVVSISAITSVYTEKIISLIPPEDKNPLDKQLKNLRREYKGTDKATVISFVEKSLETLFDFHGVEIESLQQLKQTSRVNYLVQVAESMYDPAEQFEWIDETFEDVLETDFESDEEFFSRVLEYAEEGDPDAMNLVSVLYRGGIGVPEDETKSFEWQFKSAEAGNTEAMKKVGDAYLYGEGVKKNLQKAVEWYEKAAADGESGAMVSLGKMYFEGEGVTENKVEAFNWGMKAAQLGNLVAMSNVAYQYRYGEGVQKDSSKAVEWYIKAADGGNYSAMCELAEMYVEGEGIEKDEDRAIELYKKAANSGYEDAFRPLGAIYYRKENYKKAFEYFMKAADNEDISAMGWLGMMYEHGEGVSEDMVASSLWFKKAAEKGDPLAMVEIANHYSEGLGVEKNFGDAVFWYEKSIENGYDDALKDLGILYYDNEYYTKALKYLEQAAEKGDAFCMNIIGNMYFRGKGVEQDYYKSTNWYRKSADAGNGWGMLNLGNNYANGNGVEKNYTLAIKWYKKAAENGIDDALKELGEVYYDKGDYTEALSWYNKAAEKGDALCMNIMGNMYFRGKGVKQDYYKSTNWYRKSADAGNGWGMYNLANNYANGNGVEQNSTLAIKWYKKAAEIGIDDALEELGNLYYSEENYTESFAWRKKAAEKGDAEAMNRIGIMYDNGKGVTQDHNKAANWYRKAADAGNGWGMYNLAYSYASGEGVEKNSSLAIKWYKEALNNGIDKALKEIGNVYYDKGDYTEALSWYNKAAEKGDAEAMNIVGVMYSSGKGVAQNYYKAANWYRKATEGGSIWGAYNLGNCYYSGNGVNENYSKAFELFNKAAQEGISDAMIMLGYMYQNGNHVTKDYVKANSWYEKARAAGNSDAQKYINELNEERKGGCFITTAVCGSFGKPDDCAELTAFRNFRDTWLINQPDGKNLIAEYYSIAPKIVSKIDSLTNAAQIYKNIWNKYLAPCLEFINSGDNVSCKKKYIEMVRYLSSKF